MNYFETFEKLKQALEKAKFESGNGHFAVQVVILDDDANGIFYIEDFGDKVLAEPYDYYDNDAEIRGKSADLLKLFEGKLDPAKAIEEGTITASGNVEALIAFWSRIKVPKKKTTVRKATAKPEKSTTKTTKKKTEVKKMADENKNKDTKTKDSEPIKEVVEKEIKPKK